MVGDQRHANNRLYVLILLFILSSYMIKHVSFVALSTVVLDRVCHSRYVTEHVIAYAVNIIKANPLSLP